MADDAERAPKPATEPTEPREERGAPAGKPDDGVKATGAAPAAPAAFQRWMLGALLVALAAGGASYAWHRSYADEWDRKVPRLGRECFLELMPKLKRPITMTPTEPHVLPGGETVFLADVQVDAVACAAPLGNGADQRLAAAYGKDDPDDEARALAALVTDLPASTDRDVEAWGLYLLATPAIDALPKGPVRDASREAIRQSIGCRFVSQKLPECPARPPHPTGVWVLAALGGFPVCLVLAAWLQVLAARLFPKRVGAPASRRKSED